MTLQQGRCALSFYSQEQRFWHRCMAVNDADHLDKSQCLCPMVVILHESIPSAHYTFPLSNGNKGPGVLQRVRS